MSRITRTLSLLLTLGAVASVWADTVQVSSVQEIRDAIDSANGHRTIVLPDQQLILDFPIHLKSNIELTGSSSSGFVIPDGMMIPAMYAMGTSNLVGSIVGVDANQKTIQFSEEHGLVAGDMITVKLNDWDDHADQVAEVIDPWTVRVYQRLVRVESGQEVSKVDPVQSIKLSGFRIDGGDNPIKFDKTRWVNIEGLIVTQNVLNPIVRRSLNVTIMSNVLDTVGAGWTLMSSSGVFFKENVTVRHNLAGAFFRSCASFVVQDNVFAGIPEAFVYGGNGDGITVAFSQDGALMQNSIRDTSCYGTWILNSDGIQMIGHTYYNTFTHSVYVTDSKSVLIQNSTASTNGTGFGFAAERNDGLQMHGNVGYKVPLGFYVDNNGGFSASGNVSVKTEFADIFTNNSG
ncbi:MAG: right-handed parallel beta-helix repeat-containing protein [Fimbriimonadaceae bacterium]